MSAYNDVSVAVLDSDGLISFSSLSTTNNADVVYATNDTYEIINTTS